MLQKNFLETEILESKGLFSPGQKMTSKTHCKCRRNLTFIVHAFNWYVFSTFEAEDIFSRGDVRQGCLIQIYYEFKRDIIVKHSGRDFFLPQDIEVALPYRL